MFFLLSVKKSKTSYFSSIRLYDTKFTYWPSNFEASFQNGFFNWAIWESYASMAIQIWWWSEHICCNIEIVANLIYTESDVNLLPVNLFSENPSLEGTS